MTFDYMFTRGPFGALADPTRRAVLDLLRQGSQPAGQIARAFPVSRPTISKRLRLLRALVARMWGCSGCAIRDKRSWALS